MRRQANKSAGRRRNFHILMVSLAQRCIHYVARKRFLPVTTAATASPPTIRRTPMWPEYLMEVAALRGWGHGIVVRGSEEFIREAATIAIRKNLPIVPLDAHQ